MSTVLLGQAPFCGSGFFMHSGTLTWSVSLNSHHYTEAESCLLIDELAPPGLALGETFM